MNRLVQYNKFRDKRMSEVSYFQRYSQRENHITNNVLLMMRMLYRSHPSKLQKVLESVLTEENSEAIRVRVGPTFEQQVGSSSSIPDAIISQQSFNLVVEVKPAENWNEPQLFRHLKSASDHGYANTILLLLSTDKNPQFSKKLLREATKRKVTLVSTTFDQIIGSIEQEGVIAAHETDLRDIVDDFKDLLSGEDLLEDPFTMFAFGCSQTLDWNLNSKMYYDYVERPSKAHVLTGFYANKKIHALGQVTATMCGNINTGLKVEVPHPTLSSKELTVLINNAASEMPTDDFDRPLRWYVYDELHKTDFSKSTPYGYFQGVWFNLRTFLDNDYKYTGVGNLAEALEGKTFGNDRGYKTKHS